MIIKICIKSRRTQDGRTILDHLNGMTRYLIGKPARTLHLYLNHYFLEPLRKLSELDFPPQVKGLAEQARVCCKVLEFDKNMTTVPQLESNFLFVRQLAIILSKKLTSKHLESVLDYLLQQLGTVDPLKFSLEAADKVCTIPMLLIDPSIDKIGLMRLNSFKSVNYEQFLLLNQVLQQKWVKSMQKAVELFYPGSEKYNLLEESLITSLVHYKLNRSAGKYFSRLWKLKNHPSPVEEFVSLLLPELIPKVFPSVPICSDSEQLSLDVWEAVTTEKIEELATSTLMSGVRNKQMALVACLHVQKISGSNLMKPLRDWYSATFKSG